MKNFFLIALAAVIFVACKPSGNGAGGASGAGSAREIGSSDIAFIRMDSLMNGYQRYVDLGEKFELKATKAQSDLESRARRLQNEMVDLEDKASKGLMTRSQIATTQEQLQTKATNFENDRQARLSELAEEEQVMMNQISNAITEYIKKYNEGYKYKMILSTSASTPILSADPAMDITAEVLAGLNAEYAAEPK